MTSVFDDWVFHPLPTFRQRYRRPGVCGACGCAVVQPAATQPQADRWCSGHLFGYPTQGDHAEPVLLAVRCPRHRHPSDRGE